MDLAVEPFDAEKVRQARVVAVSVPMHTALRLGVRVAERVREINPGCHLAFYGLYATLNAELLGVARRRLGAGRRGGDRRWWIWSRGLEAPRRARRGRPDRRAAAREAHLPPSRAAIALPSLKQYARLERDGRQELAGYVEASRGCRHLLHATARSRRSTAGASSSSRARSCSPTCASWSRRGPPTSPSAIPISSTGPATPSRSRATFHAAFPHVTFDVTAKIEHLLRHRARLGELADGRLPLHRLGRGIPERYRARPPRQGAHARRRSGGAARGARSRHDLAARRGCRSRRGRRSTDYRDVLDFVEGEGLIDAVDPVQLSIRLLVPPGLAPGGERRPCAPTWAGSSPRTSTTSGRTPTPPWSGCTARSRPWSRRRRRPARMPS